MSSEVEREASHIRDEDVIDVLRKLERKMDTIIRQLNSQTKAKLRRLNDQTKR